MRKTTLPPKQADYYGSNLTSSPAMFARCNSCYLVNLNYVQAIQGYTVLVGGESLQISRPRRRAFAQALNDYLGGGIT